MTTAARPFVAPPRSRLEKTLEVLSALAMAASWAIIGWYWESLPETVPTHFGAGGVPDAYGSRGNITVPAFLSLAMYVLFTGVTLIPPRFHNSPVEVSEENAAILVELTRTMVAWMKLALTTGLAWGTWSTVQTALGRQHGLGWFFLPLLVIAVFTPLVVYVRRMYRAR